MELPSLLSMHSRREDQQGHGCRWSGIETTTSARSWMGKLNASGQPTLGVGCNHALNTAAFIMGQLVGGEEITEQCALSLLRSAAGLHVGVRGFTDHELERTVISGLSSPRLACDGHDALRRPERSSPPGFLTAFFNRQSGIF